MENTLKCADCGHRSDTRARFCEQCGSRLAGPVASSPYPGSEQGRLAEQLEPAPSVIHPSERLFFTLLLVISALMYLVLIISVFGIFYIVGWAMFLLLGNGLAIGQIRGNGVRVSKQQFPEVHAVAEDLAGRMGLRPVPPIYVIQQGGILNAFAMRLLVGRKFIVIFADLFEVAYRGGKDELAFIVAHEMAHVRRGHTTWRWLLYPAFVIPFLGAAYSRATEFTADRFAAHLVPRGASRGLLLLSAGKRLYNRVSYDDFAAQTETETGFWVWLSEAMASHPRLPRRLDVVDSVFGVNSLVPGESHESANDPRE